MVTNNTKTRRKNILVWPWRELEVSYESRLFFPFTFQSDTPHLPRCTLFQFIHFDLHAAELNRAVRRSVHPSPGNAPATTSHPVGVAFQFGAFEFVGKHDYNGGLLFPYHCPEILKGLRNRTLSRYVSRRWRGQLLKIKK